MENAKGMYGDKIEFHDDSYSAMDGAACADDNDRMERVQAA